MTVMNFSLEMKLHHSVTHMTGKLLIRLMRLVFSNNMLEKIKGVTILIYKSKLTKIKSQSQTLIFKKWDRRCCHTSMSSGRLAKRKKTHVLKCC